MRRASLLAGALLVPVLPMIAAAPAYAADNIICVNPVDPADPSCDQFEVSIQAGIVEANMDGQPSTILVGPGEYLESPHTLSGSGPGTLTLKGAGQGSTILRMLDSAAAQTYVNASSATVQDLTIQMEGGANSLNDVAMILSNGAVVERVTIDGDPTQSAQGIAMSDSQLIDSTVDMTPSTGTRGVYGQGGNTITGTAIRGAQAYFHSSNGTDTLRRVTVTAGTNGGVWLDSGTVNIENAVIDLGSSGGAGIQASNFNSSTSPKVVNADHVTIVGGVAGSKGVWAYAATPTAQQSANVVLTNSIVRGPATSLVTDASNNGSQGGPSTATINVSYTDYQNTGGTIGASGAGGVSTGAGNLNVDPAFVDAAADNYRLTLGSPVIDKGNPAAGGPSTDRDGTTRVVDGDAVPGAVRDMGAYEFHDVVAPETTIGSGASGLTGDNTPTFTFTSEAGATFECRVDAVPFATCTSPHTTAVLSDGPHTFEVRATDASANTDASPATRSFTVDTVAPETNIASGPTGPTADSTPTFTFTSEAAATFECKIDGAAYAACTSPYTSAALADGGHTFSVRAKDAVSNTDTTPATRSFSVDSTAPETTITKKPAKRTTKARVKFGFTSSEAGSSFECSLDGKRFKPCTSPKRYRVALGKHVFLVRAIDALGSVDATPKKYRFTRVPRS